MTNSRTRAERETIICRAQDEDSWHVFSEDPKVVRKLTRLHGPGEAKGGGFVWLVPPSCVSFRKPLVLGTSRRQNAIQNFARSHAGKAAEVDARDTSGEVTP